MAVGMEDAAVVVDDGYDMVFQRMLVVYGL